MWTLNIPHLWIVVGGVVPLSWPFGDIYVDFVWWQIWMTRIGTFSLLNVHIIVYVYNGGRNCIS